MLDIALKNHLLAAPIPKIVFEMILTFPINKSVSSIFIYIICSLLNRGRRALIL